MFAVPELARPIAAMLAPHLSGLLSPQSDFGPRPMLSWRHDRFGIFPQNLACGADRGTGVRLICVFAEAWTD